MTLLANTPVQTDLTVPSLVFFPEVGTAAFRAAHRPSADLTDDQLLTALAAAVRQIDRELAVFKSEQEALGYIALAEVPADSYNDESAHVQSYREACYHIAHALLIEGRRDADTTRDGHQRADALEVTADSHRRAAYRAVRAIEGLCGTTVELI